MWIYKKRKKESEVCTKIILSYDLTILFYTNLLVIDALLIKISKVNKYLVA